MRLAFEVTTDLKFEAANEKVAKAGADALKEVIIKIAADAKRDTLWKFGHNSRSIEFEAEGLSGAVYSTSGYGGYLEVGTAPHGPRTANFLVWEDDKTGELIFAKWVRGIPPHPYMKPALDRHVGEFSGLVEAKLR